MKHFTIEDEIDFVNEVLPATRKLTLEEHLKGCKRCTKAVSQWRQVRKSAAAEANYQLPPEALRIAKAAFAGLQLALRGQTDSSIELVFDSLLQPSVEGFRSAGGGTRHVLYRADPFQIDLQVELQPGEKRVVVTGQLLGSRDPQIVGRDVALILANMHFSLALQGMPPTRSPTQPMVAVVETENETAGSRITRDFSALRGRRG